MSPNHEGFPEIKTKWLVLRAPLEGDAPRLLALSHDEEAMRYDHDYVMALEHGLPPTAGEGMGIDRLTMMFTNSQNIRDVIFFPHMRPE